MILDKPNLSPLQLCHKILEEYEKLGIVSKNPDGLLFMPPDEHIVVTYPNVHTKRRQWSIIHHKSRYYT